MISTLHKRIVQLTCVACATLFHTQANAWSLFKSDPPPPPPTWQERVQAKAKEVWDKSTSWSSEPKKEESTTASTWSWFKKDPPPPPPTWTERAKQVWNKSTSWSSEPPREEKKSGGILSWFKKDPPPPPTWKERAKQTWEKTKDWSADKWGKSKAWCSEHKEEIYAGAAVAGAIAVYVLTQDSNSSPSTYNGKGSSSTYNSSPSTYNSSTPSTSSYSYENSHSLIAPGRPFSQSQKMDILRQNMERNGGVLRSDLSGKELVMPKQCLPGVSPSPWEAQIDHVYPRSLGGANSAENAQVLSRGENIRKSNHVD